MPRREGRLQTEIKEGEMDVPKVAINGLGRIVRVVLKIVLKTPQLELAAANDLMPVTNRGYLKK
jgi:glyceraldehyde-3-phosphate dehydrogenase/erythrose-4-phosphate dehydrogenase